MACAANGRWPVAEVVRRLEFDKDLTGLVGPGERAGSAGSTIANRRIARCVRSSRSPATFGSILASATKEADSRLRRRQRRGRRAFAPAPPPPGSSAARYLRIVEQ